LRAIAVRGVALDDAQVMPEHLEPLRRHRPGPPAS
jgi:hypothetical protein